MHKIELCNGYRKIHFIGIGGISMSGLAEILHSQGYIVSGSDRSHSKTTAHLEDLGIKIFLGNKKENICDDYDLVVYTAAVSADNEELVEARRKNINTMDRAELLGSVMKSFKYPIAVAGTHGKTTTTSMLADILTHAEKDPTVSVGGILKSIGGNVRLGDSEYLIAEACEYCDSFLKFYPYISVILNIEKEHVDYFKDFGSLMRSFRHFAENTSQDGALIVWGGTNHLYELINGLTCDIITYGAPNCDWHADDITFDCTGCGSFDLYHKGENEGRVTLKVVGEHNILNSLAACAAAYRLGISVKDIIEGLGNYCGAERRFQHKGCFNGGVTVIDDYSHHPTEIKAALAAAKNYDCGTVYCVFQPHTYSRTKDMLDDFAESFSDADRIIITDIYAARELDKKEVHAKDLVSKIADLGKNAIYMENFTKCAEFLRKNCIPNDLLITMGAGDVYLLGEQLVNTDLSTLSTDLSTI